EFAQRYPQLVALFTPVYPSHQNFFLAHKPCSGKPLFHCTGDSISVNCHCYAAVALQEQLHLPVYHPTPGQARLASQLTEDEQVRIAQRIGLIHHLPKGVYDAGSDSSEKKIRECVICMMDFVYGDPIRFLPCMHIYHMDCIDDWLMRSFTCPSCMEPVDAALLSSYETN
uniref:RING finger protein 11 n=1 Tax=Esox lucius TaxID=8010 RepID=A0AAY5KHQ5_ESOLU